MGCNVIVFSGTDSKKEEALKLGASSFYATKGKKELDIGEHKIDCLLVTTSFQPDWNLYLPVMNNDSTIFPLTVAEGNFEIPYMGMPLAGIRIQGSVVAPRNIHRQMIDFAARNNVKPMINKYPMTVDGITEAMQILNDGKMRYRGVLIPQ
jgi:D-arabinose 1-dehydrogenase-like Zn-dependent alcohol dehydrogenase